MTTETYALGQHAARTGEYLQFNPYKGELAKEWADGFMYEMYLIRTELRVALRSFDKAVATNGILKSRLIRAEQDYESLKMDTDHVKC